MERGITVVLITHEVDIAEHGTRLVRFRDGKIEIDRPVTTRRIAAEELKLLPVGDDDTPQDSEPAAAGAGPA
jgi:putative ABC transport system ATP-binding protein